MATQDDDGPAIRECGPSKDVWCKTCRRRIPIGGKCYQPNIGGDEFFCDQCADAMCAEGKGDKPKFDNGGPAYPSGCAKCDMTGDDYAPNSGRFLRAHAAIELRIPRSGIDWLDDMIRESWQNEPAGMARAHMGEPITDAMLAERIKGTDDGGQRV